MTKLKDLKKRFMEDPEFREEYARVNEEYVLVETLVRARMDAYRALAVCTGSRVQEVP